MDAALLWKLKKGIVDIENEVENVTVRFTDEMGGEYDKTLSLGHNRIELDAPHKYTLVNVTQGKDIDEFVLNVGDYKTFRIAARNYYIYGAMWDGTASTLFSRTDDARDFTDPIPYVNNGTMTADDCYSPFDDIYPWSEIRRVEDAQAGSLVEIPKFWFKWVWPESGQGLGIRILDTDPAECIGLEETGWHTSPMHMDRHDGKGERDVAYIGRYHCANGTWKSESGKVGRVHTLLANTRNSIKNLGSNIFLIDYATIVTIWMLYLVEYATWTAANVIGSGKQSIPSSIQAMGDTDTMPYHTGTMSTDKSIYTKSIQYRYIEDPFSYLATQIDGIFYDVTNDKMFVGLDPNLYADNTSNKVYVSPYTTTKQQKYGIIKNWFNPMDYTNDEDYAWCIIPKDIDDSDEANYVTDYCYKYTNNSTANGILLGWGLGIMKYSFFSGRNIPENKLESHEAVGGRLMKLP